MSQDDKIVKIARLNSKQNSMSQTPIIIEFNIFISYAASQKENSCNGYVTEKYNLPCPNPDTFDIQTEITKPATSVKIDFTVKIF